MPSSEARLLLGLTLLTVPTIIYGGLTVLAVVTVGEAGLPPAGLEPTALQTALFRAGHAHAGVLLILSLVLQLALDGARLPDALRWSARITAPLAAILVSGGFFGLAFVPELRLLLYLGAGILAFATVTTGIGLLRARD